MGESKPRAFRWIGRGVLHINLADGSTVVVPPDGPGSIVRKAENLAALGAAFIEEMIKDGRAEAISIVDGIMEAIKPSTSTMTKEELDQAQEIAENSRRESAEIEKQAPEVLARAKATGDKRAQPPKDDLSSLASTAASQAAGPKK